MLGAFVHALFCHERSFLPCHACLHCAVKLATVRPNAETALAINAQSQAVGAISVWLNGTQAGWNIAVSICSGFTNANTMTSCASCLVHAHWTNCRCTSVGVITVGACDLCSNFGLTETNAANAAGASSWYSVVVRGAPLTLAANTQYYLRLQLTNQPTGG